jgi:predicted solute-binding protein
METKDTLLLFLSTLVGTTEITLAKQNAVTSEQATTELLRDLLILQLGLAKVPQDKIRKIAGCGMNRVNDMLKHIPKSGR